MTRTRGSLRVWSWYSHDPALGLQVTFAAAASSGAELRSLRARLQLPEPATATQLHPPTPGYAEAAADPQKAVWMPLEQFAAGCHTWLNEQQLTAARLERGR